MRPGIYRKILFTGKHSTLKNQTAMTIAQNLLSINSSLPARVKLIAVSKTKPAEVLREAYDAGQRLFGENKAQEMVQKAALLLGDIEWHFIGHLQTNKVKMIVPVVNTIHSIDSLKLLNEVNKEAEKANRMVRCLLQFHIASEETKFGLDRQEAEALLNAAKAVRMNHVIVAGVMGMATFTDNTGLIREEFRNLHNIFNWMKERWFAGDPRFCEISMGMSGDYPVAVEEGATLIRVGTAIFGEREYL